MQVIEQVGELLRDIAEREVLPRFLRVGHTRKEDGSLLTEADLACQSALEAELPGILPYPVLGEEMTRQEQDALWLRQLEGLWVVDPIDGTTNFINGLPHFAISVALMQNGRSTLGVIYNPMTQELYCATQGGGAFLNGTPLPLKKNANPMSEAIAGLDLKYLCSARLAARLNSVAPFGSQRSMGSSTLDWCYLAAGRFDVYLHGGQRLWDYAAGALILEEAGGRLASLQQDDFWSDVPWKRSVVAARDAEMFAQWHRWVRNNQ
ncbi:inositol monophosphatase family protein [Paludibacterium purpuratum]|uniref:Myo-inositol-1(Or 4)-monophosphatase n=1 Tax=Paludibacterium purpuratum TaxID=1144873 RepID=A0A4R7AXS6_9NEIS|nr:inositol monophosphatase family protein [Paludibacterium purpuratum]TDR72502.1 myo-inositol-1(or 4)-monophosphatase [Paludibacterium purpuratum]